MSIFEDAAIFRGVTKEDARQMLNCLNPVEKTYKKDEIIYYAGDEVTSMGVVLPAVCLLKMMISGGITVFWTGLAEARFLQKLMPRFRDRS